MAGVVYELLLNGRPAPAAVLAAVQRVQVEDHAELADVLRVRLAVAPADGGRGWTPLDDDPFPRLANVRLAVTVGTGRKVPLIDAYVVEHRVTFSNEPGKSVWDVVAFDPTVLMSLDEKVRAWPNATDSAVAAAVFAEYGFAPDVEDTPVAYAEEHATTVQRGTDVRLLRQLARRNGFECFVAADPATGGPVGHFHRPRVETQPQGVLSVSSGEATNVNAFSARFEMLKPAEVVAPGLDLASAEPQRTEAAEGAVKPLGRGPVAADRPRKVLLSGTGLAKAEELRGYAQAVADELSFAVRAEGELNAVAYGGVLRAKAPVLVRGAGKLFSGLYYVERVLHTFTGDGYVQKFTLKRNALGLIGREDFAADRPA